MGTYISRDARILTNRQLKDMWRRALAKLNLGREDVVKLYAVFREIAVVSPDSISYQEMIIAVRTEDKNFNRTLFRSFLLSNKSRQKGEVHFKDFVKSIWNFCSLSVDHLAYFLFDLYDSNQSGVLEPEQLDVIMMDALGTNYKTNPKSKKLMGYLSCTVSRDYFVEVAGNHIVVLYFAITMQHQFQDRICGVPFWQKVAALRRSRYGGKYVQLSTIYPSMTGAMTAGAIAVRRGSATAMAAFIAGKKNRLPADEQQASVSTDVAANSGPSCSCEDNLPYYLRKAGAKRVLPPTQPRARRKSVIEILAEGVHKMKSRKNEPYVVSSADEGSGRVGKRRKSVLDSISEHMQSLRKGDGRGKAMGKQHKGAKRTATIKKKLHHHQIAVTAKGNLAL